MDREGWQHGGEGMKWPFDWGTVTLIVCFFFIVLILLSGCTGLSPKKETPVVDKAMFLCTQSEMNWRLTKSGEMTFFTCLSTKEKDYGQ